MFKNFSIFTFCCFMCLLVFVTFKIIFFVFMFSLLLFQLAFCFISYCFLLVQSLLFSILSSFIVLFVCFCFVYLSSVLSLICLFIYFILILCMCVFVVGGTVYFVFALCLGFCVFFFLLFPFFLFCLVTLCGLQGLGSQTKDQTWVSEVGALSPGHWTTREFPGPENQHMLSQRYLSQHQDQAPPNCLLPQCWASHAKQPARQEHSPIHQQTGSLKSS